MYKRIKVLTCVVIFTAVALGSCNKREVGATAAPAMGENQPGHEEACRPPNEGGSTTFTCEFNSQCIICHDGSFCGIVVNQKEFDRRGAQCQLEDQAECEYSTSRCCNGYCTRCSF